MAGALRLRLLGPIYLKGQLVNERWMGDPNGETAADAKALKQTLWITFF